MDYCKQLPPESLGSYIRCFWQVQGETLVAAPAWHILPDGCADLLFDFSVGIGNNSFSSDSRSQWVGTMTRAIQIQQMAKVDIFAVRFAAGGLFPFIATPLKIMTDTAIEFDYLWPRHLTDPHAQLAATRNFNMRCQIISNSLLQALRSISPDNMLGMLRWLENLSELPRLKELIAHTGFSVRTLERRFIDWVGVTPKQHLRYLRFERALRFLATDKIRSVDIATLLGYSDQAHFTHEFRQFSGATPNGWVIHQDKFPSPFR